MAKLIIKLINAVADVINRDPAGQRACSRWSSCRTSTSRSASGSIPRPTCRSRSRLAGKEASGTGNMKFAMNGALTIGTLDGANVEIREAVGEENFFLFGKTVQQVEETWAAGYRPRDVYEQDEELREAIDLINSGLFSHGDRSLFRPLTDNLLNADPFLVCADFRDYVECQARVGLAYRGPGAVVADVDPQRRALRALLVGPRDPRVLRGHLEGDAAPALAGR